MKLKRIQPKWLLTAILAFHITAIQVEASYADVMRVVAVMGSSSFSAADPLNVTQQLESERLELLKRLNEINGELGKHEGTPEACDTLGAVGWSLIISLIAVSLATKQNTEMLIFEVTVAGLVMLMTSLRNALSSHVALILNLSLGLVFVAVFLKRLPTGQSGNLFTIGLGLTLGSVASIRTFSDIFTACFAAVGVSVGSSAFLNLSFEFKNILVRELFLLFMFCAVGAELAVLGVTVITGLFGVTLTIILITIGTVIVSNNLELSEQDTVTKVLAPLVVFPSCCVFFGSAVPILDFLLSCLTVCIEFLLRSFLFYPALLIGSLMLMGNW